MEDWFSKVSGFCWSDVFSDDAFGCIIDSCGAVGEKNEGGGETKGGFPGTVGSCWFIGRK